MIETKEKTNKKKSEIQEQEQKEKQKSNLLEKKIIVYIIVITLLLLYIAQLQMHDIIDRGVVNKSQESQIIYPDNNNGNNNGNNNDNGNQNNNNGNNNNNNGNQNNNGNNEQNPNTPDTPVIDNEARIRIMQGATDWKDLKELNIFDTTKNIHVTSGKIAPGVQGMYRYTVENYGNTAMKYTLNFSDENKYNINMVFKLKRNGTYVAGEANKWAKITDLSQSDLTIESNATDVYELEWRWEDAENDTEIGKTEGAYYKMIINSTATEI